MDRFGRSGLQVSGGEVRTLRCNYKIALIG